MVEHWMKQKAMRSLGGPCMTRFEEYREKKRIERLKSIKSSVKTTAMKHDRWTKQNVERRRREIIEDKKSQKEREEQENDGGEKKQMNLQIQVDGSEKTKSGLRLRLNQSKKGVTHDKRDNHKKKMMLIPNENRKGLNRSVAPAKDIFQSHDEGKENRLDYEFSALDLLYTQDISSNDKEVSCTLVR